MTDRELLELAAKAAGVTGGWGENIDYHNGAVDLRDIWILEIDDFVPWNPLTDDGDALRLAVALNIGIAFCFHRQTVTAGRWHALHEHRIAPFGQDKAGATRLAVVHSAASIGKDIP